MFIPEKDFAKQNLIYITRVFLESNLGTGTTSHKMTQHLPGYLKTKGKGFRLKVKSYCFYLVDLVDFPQYFVFCNHLKT